MNDLFELEPREAGSVVIEPSLGFDEARSALHDRTRCVTCCEDASEFIVTTRSITQ